MLTSAPAIAQQVQYEIAGTANKDALSDNIFGSDTYSTHFVPKFTVDVGAAKPVEPRTELNLPNHPTVMFAQQGHLISKDQLSRFSFALKSGSANYRLEDVVAEPGTATAVFILGPLLAPDGINIVLANEQSGYFEIGIPDRQQDCELKGGIILDSSGPFGTIQVDEISLR